MEKTETDNIWQKNKLLIKGIITGILILVLLIPTTLIQNLVEERENRQHQAVNEVSSKWASSQVLTGPVLVVPYHESVTTDKGKTFSITTKLAYLLPDELNIKGQLDPVIRYRSIYKIVGYHADVELQGKFASNNITNLKIPVENILWNDAKLIFGLTDTRGVDDQVNVLWNGNALPFNAGVPTNDVIKSGISVPVSCNVNQNYSFSISLKLKGSEKLYFTPVGKTTTVHIASSWNNPAFDGSFLPSERKIKNDGFSADWKVLHHNRNFPQQWNDEEVNVSESSFGINLLQGTDNYAKTMRSVKYAILFIGLSFALFFLIELLQKHHIHPIQYILVGIALCIFYTLLLSISEYIAFDISYLVASSATILLITFYTFGLFKKWKIAILFGSVLSMLYGFIFILIQLQDGALLAGSIGLFILLAVIMFFSRKIDWHSYGNDGQEIIEGNII